MIIEVRHLILLFNIVLEMIIHIDFTFTYV